MTYNNDNNKNKNKFFRKYSNTNNGIVSNNNNNNISNKNKKSTPYQSEAELKYYVYYIDGAKQADNYTTTTEAILNYIQKKYEEGADIRLALETMKDVDLSQYKPKKEVVDPTDKEPDEIKLEEEENNIIYNGEVKLYLNRNNKYRTNMTSAYTLIYNQCNKAVVTQIKARQDYDEIINNPIKLLQAIKEITHRCQDDVYPIKSIYYSMKKVFTIEQSNQGINEYKESFDNAVNVIESQGGKLHLQGYIEQLPDYSKADAITKLRMKTEAYNKLLAFAFMMGADQTKCGKLVEDLNNKFALGEDKFPEDVKKAVSMIIKYKNRGNNPNVGKPKNNGNNNNNNKNDVNNNNNVDGQSIFANYNKNNEDNDGKIYCYACGKAGYTKKNCPDCNNKNPNANGNNKKKVNFAQDGDASSSGGSSTTPSTSSKSNSNGSNNGILNNIRRGWINVNVNSNVCGSINLSQYEAFESYLRTWLLLDTASTDDIFCDESQLDDIHEVKEVLALNTNAGTIYTNLKGTLPGYGLVWYCPHAITNIISFKNTRKKFLIKYEEEQDVFKVLTKNNVIKFEASKEGLYYLDLTLDHSKKEETTGVALIQTVDENLQGYTPRQQERAKKACEFLITTGCPSVDDLKLIISNNGMKNCLVMV